MIEPLAILLRIVGAGLILLAVLHVPISRRLNWREEALRLSPANGSIFLVHAFFICFVLVMMGLPCLLDPPVFLERSRAGAWLSWSYSAFWTTRLYFQWFVYPRSLWRGKKMETTAHRAFTLVWILLAVVFTLCGMRQAGWLH